MFAHKKRFNLCSQVHLKYPSQLRQNRNNFSDRKLKLGMPDPETLSAFPEVILLILNSYSNSTSCL